MSPMDVKGSGAFMEQTPWRRAGVYLLILSAILCGLHGFLMTGLQRRDDPVFGRWNRVGQGRVDADVLIVGSSRAHHHYDPSVIGCIAERTCYNLGAQGTFVNMQRPLLSLYLDKNRKPDLILLDVHSLESREEVFKPLQYVTLLNDRGVYEELLVYDPLTRLDRWLPLFAIVRWELFDSSVAGWMGLDSRRDSRAVNGFVAKDKAWREDAWQAFLGRSGGGVSEPMNPDIIDTLDSMLKQVNEVGIPLVMVYSPVLTDYSARLTNRIEIMQVFRTLAEKNQVEFWDYTEDATFCDRRDYFYDVRHMSAKGAAVFSSNVAARVVSFLAGGNDAL